MTPKAIIFLSPIFILCGICFVGMFRDVRRGLPLIGVLFFLSSLAPLTEIYGRIIELWVEPIQAFRTPLLALVSGVILAGLIANAHRAATWRPSLPAILLLMVGCYGALIRLIHEGPTSGFISLVFAIVTVAPAGLLLAASIQDPGDVRAALRPFAIAGLVWLAIAFVQWNVNRKFIYVQTGVDAPYRFTGVGPNPQFTATIFAIVGPMALFLALNAPRQVYRIVWLGLFVASVPVIFATGSRTGALMFLIGCLPGIVGRMGVAALLVPPAGLAAWFIAQLFTTGKFAVDLSRIVSTENTRGRAWSDLLRQGLSNPIIGVGIESAEASENSYLYGFAVYGAGMLLILALLAATGVWLGLRLVALLRRPNTSPSRLAIYAASVLGAYLAGSVFEGYAIARVNHMSYVWLLGCAIAVAVLRTDRAPDDGLTLEELEATGALEGAEDHGPDDDNLHNTSHAAI